MRVLFVSSSGGHLDQLLDLLPAPPGVEIAAATFAKPDIEGKLPGIPVYPLYWPTNRSVKALVINGWRAVRVLREFRPDVVVSSGAAAAVSFFLGAHAMRIPTVYIECVDRVRLPTLTARLVKPMTSLFVAQWKTQLVDWPRRVYVGASR